MKAPLQSEIPWVGPHRLADFNVNVPDTAVDVEVRQSGRHRDDAHPVFFRLRL